MKHTTSPRIIYLRSRKGGGYFELDWGGGEGLKSERWRRQRVDGSREILLQKILKC